MTQTERTRFTILIVLLVLLVAAGLFLTKFRREGNVGASTLGVIENQAVSTFTSKDGIELTSLSNVSRINVGSGNNTLVINYSLGDRPNQNAVMDIQFFVSQNNQLRSSLSQQQGQGNKLKANLQEQQGKGGNLRVTAESIPNSTYHIAVKPVDFLSQAKYDVPYENGKTAVIDFPEPFRWGDINEGQQDNVVNNADWSILVSAWNTGDTKTDYNADGVVNNVDASVMLNNWGTPGEQFSVKAGSLATPSSLPTEPPIP